MRNAGWFDAGFFAGSEPRFFSEPGFWSRSDALRRPERGAGLATRGASAGLAGLWGSAVRVILQDWQDRWNVAQIGDIPETGDPRWGLFRLSVKSYAKGLGPVFRSLSNSHLDRRICIA